MTMSYFEEEEFNSENNSELSSLKGGEFICCEFNDLDLSGLDASGAKFIECKFNNSNLSNLNLLGANFSKANMKGSNFSHAINFYIDITNTN